VQKLLDGEGPDSVGTFVAAIRSALDES